MKILLLGEDAIRLEPAPGPLTIEADSTDTSYSPFHMLASALATCTFSVMHSWATHKKMSWEDLRIDVKWKFGEDPHRVSHIAVTFEWPSLPADRLTAAKRVAALCTVHATLMHPPVIDIASAGEASMRGEPAAAPVAAS